MRRRTSGSRLSARKRRISAYRKVSGGSRRSAGSVPGWIDYHVGVPRLSDRFLERFTVRGSKPVLQRLAVELYPGGLPVMSHAEIALNADRPQAVLGTLNRFEPSDGHGRAMRDARRQAWSGRLIPCWNPSLTRPLSYLRFG